MHLIPVPSFQLSQPLAAFPLLLASKRGIEPIDTLDNIPQKPRIWFPHGSLVSRIP
jgi:hypothetical protein